MTGTEEFRSFQLLHTEEVFKVDAFVLTPSDYTQALWRRRVRLPFGPDYQAWLLSPEDIVLTKLRWFVSGGRVSDRQWNDVVQVLEAQWQTFDFPYIEGWSVDFGVRPELERAKAQVILPQPQDGLAVGSDGVPGQDSRAPDAVLSLPSPRSLGTGADNRDHESAQSPVIGISSYAHGTSLPPGRPVV